jgi:hypothetical protein
VDLVGLYREKFGLYVNLFGLYRGKFRLYVEVSLLPSQGDLGKVGKKGEFIQLYYKSILLE